MNIKQISKPGSIKSYMLYHEDPDVFHVNTLPNHCYFVPFKKGQAPAADGPGWGLELFEDGKSVKRIRGGAVPEQWPAFRSILDLCSALAENRRQSLHCLRNDEQAG